METQNRLQRQHQFQKGEKEKRETELKSVFAYFKIQTYTCYFLRATPPPFRRSEFPSRIPSSPLLFALRRYRARRNLCKYVIEDGNKTLACLAKLPSSATFKLDFPQPRVHGYIRQPCRELLALQPFPFLSLAPTVDFGLTREQLRAPFLPPFLRPAVCGTNLKWTAGTPPPIQSASFPHATTTTTLK